MHDSRSAHERAALSVGWRGLWLPGLLGVMLLLGLSSALSLALDIGRAYGGFYAIHHFNLDLWTMDSLTPRWWPILTATGLGYEDVLIGLDGQPYGIQQADIYAAAQARGASTIPLSIDRAGTRLELPLPVVSFTLGDYLDLKLPDFITGLGFWLLGVVIYLTRPTEAVNRIFAVAATCITGYLWLTHGGLFEYTGTVLYHLTRVAWTLCVCVIGVTIVHCALLFPQPARASLRRWLPWLYAVSIGVALSYALAMELRWQFVWTPLVHQIDAFDFRFATLTIGAGVGFMLLRFSWSYGRDRATPRRRRQLTILLVGLLCTLPIVISSMVGAMLRQTQYLLYGLDLRYSFLALPLAFAYVILRYQTFRSAPPRMFVAVVILISAALFASVGDGLARQLQPELRHSLFAPIFALTLLASLMWSTQGVFQRGLNRVFRWEETSYRAVKHFGESLAGRGEFSRLPELIVQALVTELKVEQAAIWLRAAAIDDYDLAAQAGQWATLPPTRLVLQPDQATVLDAPRRLDEKSPAGLQPLRSNTVLEAIVPLAGPSGPIGLLGIGKHWDEEIFHDRDLEIAELIAQQAALFLLTAQQIDELKRVPRRVAEAQERERFKIAQELHDTIQQFLGRLPFFLEVSRSLAYDDPARTDELLQRSIEDVEQAAKTVRQIRANLAPFQLQTSFVQPLQDLVDHFRARQQLETRCTLASDLDQHLSLEARHALYRVVQQALDNVAEHAQARHVAVTLNQVDGRVSFDIVDDGVGSAEADRAQAAAQGSFGLKSMRDRIEAQGGEFEIVSQPGQGTIVRGWVPVKRTTTD